MKKIKICYLVNDLAIGGVPKVVLSLVKDIDLNKFEISIICLSSSTGMLDSFALAKEVKLYVIPVVFPDKYGIIDYVRFAFSNSPTNAYAAEVIDKIVEIKPDILHFHALPRQLKIGEIAKKSLKDIILIHTEHTRRISASEYKWHQEFMLEIIFRRLYRPFHLIAVSNSVSNYINERRLRNPSNSFITILNRIDLNYFKRKNPLSFDAALNLICISRLSFMKGQHTLINAWKSWQHPSKGRLFIIGPDETAGEIPAMAENDKSIEIIGAVSDSREWLEKSHIGVVPSAKEGLPLALLEKMAYNLSTIVSDIDELTSIVDDEIEGKVFKLNDVDDLRSKFDYLANQADSLEKMGQNARKKVEDQYNDQNWTNGHQNFYFELTKKS